MAISAPTKTSDFSGFIQPTIAAPIFEKARVMSTVQQLAQQVPLGFNGSAVPVTTSKPTAGWVAEGTTKPATTGAATLKTITPKKLAAIMVVSAEVVRANPGGYMDTLRPNLAEAFALAFDKAALHDEGPDGTPGGGPFATYIDQSTKSHEIGSTTNIHTDLVEVLQELISHVGGDGRHKRLTGWALDDLMEYYLQGALDGSNRPLYIDLPTDETSDALARPGRLLGRPSYMGEGVIDNSSAIYGYGGDWREAAWGVVGGITYDVSTEASVTIDGSLVSLWENNLLAIRAEAEYGFLVNDTAAFVQLRNDAGS